MNNHLRTVTLALVNLLHAEWQVTHDWGGNRDVIKANCYEAIAQATGKSVDEVIAILYVDDTRAIEENLFGRVEP